MKILYIHGLNSLLSLEKRQILEQYGDVFAPTLNYKENPNAIADIIAQYADHSFQVIMGSSMGGFAGFYASNHFKCPALLFNPALSKRPVTQQIPETLKTITHFKQLVLGTEDEVVNPKDTLQFIANLIDQQPQITLHLKNKLAHRIPLPVFKAEVEAFFNTL
ncbi:YqiA/YcfP family alpha/beta fold hydrolase [Winogradskyella arenosi]|uniref:Esterase n=1 Tax=Winogradskyella arenosi TaxID=533325 RepID=A0A368ZEY6_9FLAO|nr:YqiA/YcfP family alpha/beta fold hydrolase [Winogradskyella arenosi]RCW91466.1 hypothetical protein DFQ08_103296 [Winogradskyella arenosi]